MKTISVSIPKGAKNVRTQILETEGKVYITFDSDSFSEKQEEEQKSNVISPEYDSDGNLTLEEYLDKYFPIVRASTLSLEDGFLKYKPKTKSQKKFKKMLVEAIKSNLQDFRAQRMDAAVNNQDEILFCAGLKPAVGKSVNWWKEKAEKFMPEKGSRLGTTKQRIAFLGLLIKYLIEEKGYEVSYAWEAVCDQSKNLGHYRDSKFAKRNLENTASRQVSEWYDLGNTFKITTDDVSKSFSLFGGDANSNGNEYPLADVCSISSSGNGYFNVIGWIVLLV